MAQTSREKGMGSAWLLPVLEAQSTDVLVPTHGPSCPRLGRMPYALFLANGPSSCLACYHVGTMEVLLHFTEEEMVTGCAKPQGPVPKARGGS
jgi:hypothetical protein